MYPWLFKVYMEPVKDVKMWMERDRLPRVFYTDDLVLCRESKDLGAMVGHFVEVCECEVLKANADKSKVTMLNGEEELECEVCADGMQLEKRNVELTSKSLKSLL